MRVGAGEGVLFDVYLEQRRKNKGAPTFFFLIMGLVLEVEIGTNRGF